MASFQRQQLPWTTLIGNSSTAVKFPATGWIAVNGATQSRGRAEVRAIAGTGTEINLGIELCTDPRNPDSGLTNMWATGPTANGMKDPDSTLVELAMSGKLYYRWVWTIKVTSGTGWATVSGVGETIGP